MRKFFKLLKNNLLVVSFFVTFFVFMFHQGYFDNVYKNFLNRHIQNCSFCHADGHYEGYCPTKAVRVGAYGRWVIPSVGVNVACYLPGDGADLQEITDVRDSAALFRKADTTYIADHNYQGFNPIRKCKVGDKAYMFTGNDVSEYVCTAVIEGFNSGDILTDIDGQPLNFYVDGGITNYTCNYFKDTVTIVQFAPIL